MKKFLLLFSIAMVFVLVGCGAQIDSQININKDGSGERVSYVFIANDEVSYISGGIEALDEVLQANRPEFVTITKSQVNNGFRYELKYEFDDVNDYNNKTSILTGGKHTAEIVQKKDLFGERVEFKEPNVMYETVKWAIDAIDNAEIVNQSRSDLYELGNINVSTELYSKSFSSSSDTVHLKYEDVFPISNITVSTITDFDQKNQRDITLFLKNEILDKIGEDNLDNYLQQFYDGFTKSGYDEGTAYSFHIDLNAKDNIKATMMEVSGLEDTYLNIGEGEYSNPLHKVYLIEEAFNLDRILNSTYVEGGILYTLHLPTGFDSDIYSNGKVTEERHDEDGYVSSIWFSDTDLMELKINLDKKVYVSNVNVTVDIKKNSQGTKKIEYIFNKETSNEAGRETIDDFFKSINDQIKIYESGSKVIYEDTMTINNHSSNNREHFLKDDSIMYLKKSNSSTLWKSVINFYDLTSFNKVLGNLNVEEDITYSLKIPKAYNIVYAEYDGYIIDVQDFKNSKDNFNVISFDTYNNEMEIKFIAEKSNSIIIVLVVIGSIVILGLIVFAVYLIIRRKKKNLKNIDDHKPISDDVYNEQDTNDIETIEENEKIESTENA